MKELTSEQLYDNYVELCNKIKSVCSEERAQKIINMYEAIGERFVTAPASPRNWWHCAYPGGLIEHTLHVIKNAEKVAELYKLNGGNINFTHEELVVVAAHHDFGKVGNLSEEYYLPNDSDWHIKNRGELFKFNPKMQPFMTVTDRALWLLQHFDIKLSVNETLAIQLSDGLFEDSNKKYIVNTSFREETQLKNNLCYIIHWADWMSCRQEYDVWSREKKIQQKKDNQKIRGLKSSIQSTKKPGSDSNKRYNDLFDDLFDDTKNSTTGD